MKKFLFGFSLLVIGLLFLFPMANAEASGLPPYPNVYTGNILINGVPAPDGSVVVGKVGDYTSQPVTVKNGRYVGLAVGAPDSSYFGKAITFHLDDSVVANETDVFQLNVWFNMKSPFDLTFPSFPTPTPTSTPTPTNTPVATPTPDIPSAMILSGVVELDVGDVGDLEGKEIVARIGSFFSAPAILEIASVGSFQILVFDGLLVDPRDYKFTGQPIAFIVDGLEPSGDFPNSQPGGGADVALRISLPPTPVPVIEEATQVPIPAPTEVPTVAPAAPVVVPTAAPAPVPSPIILIATPTPQAVEVASPVPEPTVVVVVQEEEEEVKEEEVSKENQENVNTNEIGNILKNIV